MITTKHGERADISSPISHEGNGEREDDKIREPEDQEPGILSQFDNTDPSKYR